MSCCSNQKRQNHDFAEQNFGLSKHNFSSGRSVGPNKNNNFKQIGLSVLILTQGKEPAKVRSLQKTSERFFSTKRVDRTEQNISTLNTMRQSEILETST